MKNTEEYLGSAQQYIRDFIIPSMPSFKIILKYHSQIKDYLEDRENIRFVRHFANFKLRGYLYEDDGVKFYGGDNEMPLWIYMKCSNNEEPNIEYWLHEQIPPIAWKRDEGSTYKTVGRQKNERDFSNKGWKHSHLLTAAPRVNISLDARMVRYIHPLNHFPSPSTKRWLFSPPFYRNDLGEDPKFHQLIWSELFAKNRDNPRFEAMFDEFLLMAEGHVDIKPSPVDFQFTLFRRGNSNLKAKIVTQETNPYPEDVQPIMAPGVDFNKLADVDKSIKGFKIQKSWIGKGYIVLSTFSRGQMQGRSVVYNHDEIYNYAKDKLNELPSFQVTGINVNSSSVPQYARPYVQWIYK